VEKRKFVGNRELWEACSRGKKPESLKAYMKPTVIQEKECLMKSFALEEEVVEETQRKVVGGKSRREGPVVKIGKGALGGVLI